MRFISLTSAILWASMSPTIAVAQGPQLFVPVAEESYHVPIFENEYVVAIHVQIPGGRASGYHVHDHDQFGAVVAPYPAKAYTQLIGQAPNAPRTATMGEASFMSAAKTPVTHRVVNADTLQLDRYDIVLKSNSPLGFTPSVRNSDYKQVIDNERVRAWRLTLLPGQTVSTIKQESPGLRIVILGGEIAEITPGRQDRAMQLTNGGIFWQNHGATRAIKNTGLGKIEILEFELK